MGTLTRSNGPAPGNRLLPPSGETMRIAERLFLKARVNHPTPLTVPVLISCRCCRIVDFNPTLGILHISTLYALVPRGCIGAGVRCATCQQSPDAISIISPEG